MGSMYQRIRATHPDHGLVGEEYGEESSDARMRSRASRSIAWSASVTKERSGFVEVGTSRRNQRRAISSAASQMERPSSSQARRSASGARRREALHSGPKPGVGSA